MTALYYIMYNLILVSTLGKDLPSFYDILVSPASKISLLVVVLVG